MAGTSYTDLEAQYGELSGTIPSQWGEDVMASVDDKLHMSEQTSVQTVQGPLNWSKTGAVHTFASPLNISATAVSTFAGPFNATSTGINTFAGPLDINNTLNLLGIATFQTDVNIGSNLILSGQFSNIGTFAAGMQTLTGGSCLEFSTDTTLAGNSNTAYPSEQAIKSYVDSYFGIGTSNKRWLPAWWWFIRHDDPTKARDYGVFVTGSWLANTGDDTTISIYYVCPAPATLGDKYLHMDSMKVGIDRAIDANYYIDQRHFWGVQSANEQGISGMGPSDLSDLTTIGIHTWNFATWAVNDYSPGPFVVGVRLQIACASTTDWIRWSPVVTIQAWYDD